MGLMQNKTVKIGLTIILFISLLLAAVAIVKVAKGGVGYTFSEMFTDQKLAAAVAAQLEKSVDDEITQADIDASVDWRFVSDKIYDLSGIEYFTKLEHLDLGDNQISDLIPLAGLNYLNYLDLKDNQISDLIPLAGLNYLDYLDLESNQISDLIPLAGLNYLTYLNLESNQISDLSPLSELTGLQSLHLSSQRISLNRISCSNTLSIENMIRNIDGSLMAPNDISDSGTYSNSNLSWEGLSSDISGVYYTFNQSVTIGLATASFKGEVIQPTTVTRSIVSKNEGGVGYTFSETFTDQKLAAAVADRLGKSVDAEITQADIDASVNWRFVSDKISDISGIEHFIKLMYLSLKANKISDLSPLTGLTNLEWLELYENEISDLSPLMGLTNLNYLNLSANEISDLSPLTGLVNLNHLNLRANEIRELSPLTRLTNLTTLSLGKNHIRDLRPLTGLTNLYYLALPGNEISDLGPLAELTYLTTLTLENNEIRDLSPLTGLTNLTYLELYGNEISDLSPLAGMTKLTTLSLEFQHISLNSINRSNTVSIENMIKNVDGSLIAPKHIRESGTYSNPNLNWDGLSSNISEVGYTFDQSVTIGSASTTFRGTVTQPMVRKNISD